MKPTDPLLARWKTILSRKDTAPAIFNTGGELVRTFRGIEQRSRDFESRIDIFPAGSVIAVKIGNHEDWPSVFLACLRRKLVVLPIEQSVSEQQRDAALKICCASAVVTGPSSPRDESVRLADRTGTGGGDLDLLPSTTSTAPINWGENPPSLLKLTSGTTAAPRAIRFRSEQLLADCDQICETMAISDVDLNFAVIPISHSYGFSNLLTPLIARGVAMVVSRDRTPRAVLADLARTNATIFPGTPVFYQAFCEMENVLPPPKRRLCISAGAPLSIAVAKTFCQGFGLAIHSFYGASECGGICYDRDAAGEIPGFVGTPMQDVDLEMVDSNSESSQVRVRSAAAGDGYFPEPDPDKLGNGAFVPDDLLAKSAAGLKIVGRVSDLINVAGKKVNPAEVEAQLLRFQGVRQAIAFGRGSVFRNEEIAACVVGDVAENELLEFCRKALSPWQVPKRIFIVESIPANERGKISRRDLAERFGSK